MKHRRSLFISLACLVLLVSFVFGTQFLWPTTEYIVEIDGSGMVVDLGYVSTQELFDSDNATLVVRAKYNGVKNQQQIFFNGKPVQFQSLSVQEVYKGTCENDITILTLGGEANTEQAIRYMQKNNYIPENVGGLYENLEWTQKNASEEEWDQIWHTTYRWVNDYTYTMEVGKEYLLYLKWWDLSNTEGCYINDASLYGRDYVISIRELNEYNQALNPYTGNFETVDFMQ